MVLELKQPLGDQFKDLFGAWPTLMAYLISFLFVAVFWVNHHMIFLRTKTVNIRIIWCNIFWLLAMSLIPFASAWVGEFPTSRIPLSIYFGVMTIGSILFHQMYYLIEAENGRKDKFHLTFRNYASIISYVLVTILCGFSPLAAYIVAGVVTLWWVIPEKKKVTEDVKDNPESK